MVEYNEMREENSSCEGRSGEGEVNGGGRGGAGGGGGKARKRSGASLGEDSISGAKKARGVDGDGGEEALCEAGEGESSREGCGGSVGGGKDPGDEKDGEVLEINLAGLTFDPVYMHTVLTQMLRVRLCVRARERSCVCGWVAWHFVVCVWCVCVHDTPKNT